MDSNADLSYDQRRRARQARQKRMRQRQLRKRILIFIIAVVAVILIFAVSRGISSRKKSDAKKNENIQVSEDVKPGSLASLVLHKRAIHSIQFAHNAFGYQGEAKNSAENQKETLEEGPFRASWDTEGIDGQPYLVAVNISRNTVTVFTQDASGQYTVPDRAFVCSVGENTPTGYYYTLDRYRWQELYNDSYGQYATRIMEHILFHSVPYEEEDPSSLEYNEYNLLGETASLGCVRLSVADAKWIYDNCPDEFPCVLYEDNTCSGPLGKPEPLKIDTTDTAKRGWDPTDPDPANPWNKTGTDSAAGTAGTESTASESEESAGYQAEPDESSEEQEW